MSVEKHKKMSSQINHSLTVKNDVDQMEHGKSSFVTFMNKK